MRGTQVVLSVEGQYTAWNGVILGPFYHGIPSLTVVYHGKPLSFSTGDVFIPGGCTSEL